MLPPTRRCKVSENKIKVLTVIMADYSPCQVGSSPNYRTVKVVLTQEQQQLIAGKHGMDAVDRCFIEEAPDAK